VPEVMKNLSSAKRFVLWEMGCRGLFGTRWSYVPGVHIFTPQVFSGCEGLPLDYCCKTLEVVIYVVLPRGRLCCHLLDSLACSQQSCCALGRFK
jgi:hypothetical protein